MNINSIEDYEINIPDGLVKEWATENGWVQGSKGEGSLQSLRRQLKIASEALEIKDQLCEALRDKVDDLEQELKQQLVDKEQQLRQKDQDINTLNLVIDERVGRIATLEGQVEDEKLLVRDRDSEISGLNLRLKCKELIIKGMKNSLLELDNTT